MALEDARALKPPCKCKGFDTDQIVRRRELSCNGDVEAQREYFEELLAGDVFDPDDRAARAVVVMAEAQAGHRSLSAQRRERVPPDSRRELGRVGCRAGQSFGRACWR